MCDDTSKGWSAKPWQNPSAWDSTVSPGWRPKTRKDLFFVVWLFGATVVSAISFGMALSLLIWSIK